MIRVVFLSVLFFVWCFFAVLQDLRKREIADWLNFSLLVFALGFRFFWSLFSNDFRFFYQGIIGTGIFLALAYLFYYSRFFAGGDAKLLISLGAIVPFSNDLFSNLKIFACFFTLFFFVGGFYVLLASLVLGLKNFREVKKFFLHRLYEERIAFFVLGGFSLVLVLCGFFSKLSFIIGVLVFLLSFFYLYAISVDRVCMVKRVRPSELREGDWLFEDVFVNGKRIRASWDGLSSKEISILRKARKSVLIRGGVPFSPAFLISFVLFVLFWFRGWCGFDWIF